MTADNQHKNLKEKVNSLTDENGDVVHTVNELIKIISDDKEELYQIVKEVLDKQNSFDILSILDLRHENEQPQTTDDDATVIDNLLNPANEEEGVGNQIKVELKESLAVQLDMLARSIPPLNYDLANISRLIADLATGMRHHGVLDFHKFSELITSIQGVNWAGLLVRLHLGNSIHYIQQREYVLKLVQAIDSEYDRGYNDRKEQEAELNRLDRQALEKKLRSEFRQETEKMVAKHGYDLKAAREQGAMDAFEQAYDMIMVEGDSKSHSELEKLFSNTLSEENKEGEAPDQQV